MKIEVFDELTRKAVFSFPNDKTVIVGRQADANILLEGDDISRDHVHINYKNDGVYITDQGSTCGVFINEERIPAFKDVEFTTYFQVRVGKKYFLSLISHEDEDEILKPVKVLSNQDRSQTLNAYKTSAIRPKAIAEKAALAKTSTNIIPPKGQAKTKVVSGKKKVEHKSSSSSTTTIIIFVLAAAVAYWLYSQTQT